MPFVVFVFARFFYLPVFIIADPFTFAIFSVDISLHAFLTAFIKIFPQTIVGILFQDTAHLQFSGLIKKFPDTSGLVIGELAPRLHIAVEIIRDVSAMKDVANSILYLIGFFRIFLFGIVKALPCESLSA